MSWDDLGAATARLKTRAAPAWSNYLGFYSSWLGGFFREPWAMAVPLDDHGFHRGDGVFEAVRLFDRAFIDLDEHLARLGRSAEKIGLEPPQGVREICVKLGRLCAVDHGVLRLYVTRGPGSFSPAPKESVGAQVYAAITTIKPPSAEMYEKGCRALEVTVPAKDPFYAGIKSLNYLQNVLMKRECEAAGADLGICFDEAGRVCEGATENVLIVDEAGRVRVPKFDYTLPGTTVRRVMALVLGAEFAELTRGDLAEAREIAFVGTTLGVLPVGRLGPREIPVGPVASDLQRRWLETMGSDPGVRTAF